jgi:hypothetical protein
MYLWLPSFCSPFFVFCVLRFLSLFLTFIMYSCLHCLVYYSLFLSYGLCLWRISTYLPHFTFVSISLLFPFVHISRTLLLVFPLNYIEPPVLFIMQSFFAILIRVYKARSVKLRYLATTGARPHYMWNLLEERWTLTGHFSAVQTCAMISSLFYEVFSTVQVMVSNGRIFVNLERNGRGLFQILSDVWRADRNHENPYL